MPNYKIEIEVRDVADGDILFLVEGIENNYGEDFDMAKRDFNVLVKKEIEPNFWTYYDLNED